MKISVKHLRMFSLLLLAAVSLLCVYILWHSFEYPSDLWQKKHLSVSPEKTMITGTPLQFQLLPWRSYFLVDKNRPVRGVAIEHFLQQNDIKGLSVALMHAGNAQKSGVSFSLVELSGQSSGLSMVLAGGAVENNGVALGLWNISENNNGIQFGVINQSQDNIIADYTMKPKKTQDNFGVQAGVVNYSESKGVQFGLWNTNPNSIIKHFPLINICF